MKENPHTQDQPLEQAYHVAKLIAGYIQGTLSPKEHDELDEWVAASDENMKLFEELTDEQNIEQTMEWYRKINEEAALKKLKERIGLRPKKNDRTLRFLLYAAMVVIIAGTALFVYQRKKEPAGIVQNDVQPGSNKAVLTLSDGRKIELDSVNKGVIGEQGVVSVLQEDGAIKYNGQLAVSSGEVVYNTVSVPRGGQYKIVLSDGTAVWLNSESELKYPVVFAEDREVVLKGEGYFEVASSLSPSSSGLRPPSPEGEGNGKNGLNGAQKKRSFSVNMNGARVEVLGTHFNVKNYEDEDGAKVVLLEGKVRVMGRETADVRRERGDVRGETKDLVPGQMAEIDKNGRVKVGEANVDETMAWKNGNFYFTDATIQNIMQQLKRWYNIEVEYKGQINYHFNAPDVPRSLPLSKVLKVLEMTKKVRFEVEGRRVRVRDE